MPPQLPLIVRLNEAGPLWSSTVTRAFHTSGCGVVVVVVVGSGMSHGGGDPSSQRGGNAPGRGLEAGERGDDERARGEEHPGAPAPASAPRPDVWRRGDALGDGWPGLLSTMDSFRGDREPHSALRP